MGVALRKPFECGETASVDEDIGVLLFCAEQDTSRLFRVGPYIGKLGVRTKLVATSQVSKPEHVRRLLARSRELPSLLVIVTSAFFPHAEARQLARVVSASRRPKHRVIVCSLNYGGVSGVAREIVHGCTSLRMLLSLEATSGARMSSTSFRSDFASGSCRAASRPELRAVPASPDVVLVQLPTSIRLATQRRAATHQPIENSPLLALVRDPHHAAASRNWSRLYLAMLILLAAIAIHTAVLAR